MKQENATQRRLAFVLEAACTRWKLDSWDPLFTTRRTKQVALVRHCVMAVLREGLGMSTVEIGELFDRDHTTVIYALQKVGQLDAYQQLLAEVVSAFPGEGLLAKQSPAARRDIQNNPQAGAVVKTEHS